MVIFSLFLTAFFIRSTAGLMPGIRSGLISSFNFGLRKTEPARTSVIPRLSRTCARRGETFSDFANSSALGWGGRITHCFFPESERILLLLGAGFVRSVSIRPVFDCVRAEVRILSPFRFFLIRYVNRAPL